MGEKKKKLHCVCYLQIKPFVLPVDMQHTRVRADSSLLERYLVQALWSQKTRQILHTNNVVSRVDNEMTRRRSGYDIQMLAIRMP